MTKEITLKEHINNLANKEKIKNSAPRDGDRNADGKIYSSAYGGYVPGLYAQGR